MGAVRRYAMTFFAVCVALAAGIALGAGPLQTSASADADPSTDTTALDDRISSLEGSRLFDESVAEAAQDVMLGSQLDRAAVTLVALPGASEAAVTDVSTAVERAGGLVTVTARVAERLVDPAQKTYTDSVAASSSEHLRDLPASAANETYAQIAALFARAYVGSGDDLLLDDEAVKIDSELRGAKLVTLSGEPKRRGSLVVVVGSGAHGSDDVITASHLIEVELLRALVAASDAALLMTPPTGTSAGGLVAAAAADPTLDSAKLSTLNVSDGAAAAIAAVHALAATAQGRAGAFGVDGHDVTRPPTLLAIAGG